MCGAALVLALGAACGPSRGGERHVIAADVYGFEVPFHGTDRELEEILFGVRHPERGGLWRFVLP